jgi:hypothetical protein
MVTLKYLLFWLIAPSGLIWGILALPVSKWCQNGVLPVFVCLLHLLKVCFNEFLRKNA